MNTRRSGAANEHSFVEVKPDLYPVNAKICQLVEQFPCMYDRSHPHYLKKEVVERAWVKIAKEMNDSISLCKERWRNIRTSFARSINVRKVPASANRTKPYYLHEELKFLTHHITPGVPVPRRTSIKKRNSTLGDDDESEEIKVSMSEESFDSFAALVPKQIGDHDDDDNDEEQESETPADVLSADSNSDDATTEDDEDDNDDEQQSEQSSQIGVACQIGMPNIQIRPPTPVVSAAVAAATAAAAPPPTVAVEVAPLVLPNVCPCPPKKRQRLQAHNDDDAVAMPSTVDAEAKINTNTTQQLQQQMPQTPEHIRAASVHTAANDFDFDDAFLQGLRPEMKVMTFQQKVYFKRRIYDLLGEIFPHTNSLEPVAANASSSSGSNESGGDLNSNEMLRRLNTILAPTLAQPPIATMPVAYNNNTTNVNNNNSSNNNATVTVVPTSVLMPPRLRAVGRPNPVASTTANAAQRTAPQLIVRLPVAKTAATTAAPATPTTTFNTPLAALLGVANGQTFLKQEAPDHADN